MYTCSRMRSGAGRCSSRLWTTMSLWVATMKVSASAGGAMGCAWLAMAAPMMSLAHVLALSIVDAPYFGGCVFDLAQSGDFDLARVLTGEVALGRDKEERLAARQLRDFLFEVAGDGDLALALGVVVEGDGDLAFFAGLHYRFDDLLLRIGELVQQVAEFDFAQGVDKWTSAHGVTPVWLVGW